VFLEWIYGFSGAVRHRVWELCSEMNDGVSLIEKGTMAYSIVGGNMDERMAQRTWRLTKEYVIPLIRNWTMALCIILFLLLRDVQSAC
jgi:hypothetical protein